MACDGKTCHGFGCPNFYINEGKVGCLQHHATSSFKASNGNLNAPEQSVQEQFQEIYRLINQYRQLSVQTRKSKQQGLVARIKVCIDMMKREMLEDQKLAALAARRRQLIMAHPWGYMNDLGYKFSTRSLELMEKAQPRTEFDSYRELTEYFNHPYSGSLLANPERLAAFRSAANE